MSEQRVEQALASWIEQAASVMRSVDVASVARAVRVLDQVRTRGGVVYVAGNGGSASTASHLALDLQKTARDGNGPGVRAVSLCDSIGLITAWGNDAAFERVFAEQLDALGRPGDAVVVISVSGASQNLIALLEVARGKGLTSIGLLGKDGGRARDMVDVAVVVESGDYGWVESAHVVVHHVLTYALRDVTSRASLPRQPASAG